MVLEQVSWSDVRVSLSRVRRNRLYPLLVSKHLAAKLLSTEAYLYRYSWDLDDLQTYPWDEHYVKQPQVMAYLQHVTKKFDLRKDMYFNTELMSASWDDAIEKWVIETSTDVRFEVRYLITSLGLLSKRNFPDIPGIDSFQGEKVHTGAWPASATTKGKKVGIIGNGSTGVQVITAIAKDVAHLTCFQRNPQYSVPSGDGPVDPEYRKYINENYPELWRKAKNEEAVGFGLQEASRSTFSVSEKEREQIYETAWKKGGGFRFMFETFGDITVDEAANISACEYIKKKIRETVKDPKKAEKLMPTQLYARRPLCDAGYYEQFNKDNVDIVNLNETPIEQITPDGIRTADGKEHVLDMIIFATGFDAVDGNYTRLRIQGRGGQSLKEHWAPKGPTTYLGVCVSDFPNLFMITGPNGPFCNIPPAIETHVEFITDIIKDAEERHKREMGTKGISNGSSAIPQRHDHPVIEADTDAEQYWTNKCDELSANSLFRKTDSWIFGANVKGKKHAVLFYFGGLSAYRKELQKVVDDGYKGFKPF